MRALEIYVRGHSPCNFMHDLYMAEIYRPGTIFAADSMVGSVAQR